MQEEKTEGIVVRSQDYKERHRIITLFTPLGLISLIVRNISRKNTRLLSLTTPFCHAEYLYRRSNSELLAFRDGTVLDDHLGLRQSLKSLQIAGSLANAILTSQMADKPAPALFSLYRSYHNQVPHFSNPEVLLASFQLKLLKHEGLLNIGYCAEDDSTSPFILGEGEEGFHFSDSEWDELSTLGSALQFSSLRDLRLSPFLAQKIDALFRSRITQ
jgi:DNA repair protein RecO (recombination protein O)